MSQEEPMYFFMADISGYTAFMLKNQMDYSHGTLIVTELISALVKEVQVPLEISKLEGDALFLFMTEKKAQKVFGNNRAALTNRLLRLFSIFYDKLHKMQISADCKCGGCSNIDKLNLKIVAHWGNAAIVDIGSFRELSGVDVILLHRLLKNKVQEKRYFLLTENAYKRLPLPAGTEVTQSQEEDQDIGVIPVYIFYPQKNAVPDLKRPSPLLRYLSHLKLAFAEWLIKVGIRKQGVFHNIPQP